MPTYVYACDDCGVQFEQFQRFSDAPLSSCPSCSGGVRRVFQPVGVVFKGSGWYSTDHRKSGGAPAGGNEAAKSESSASSTSSDTSAKAETKGDAKAETKGDAKAETKGDAKAA